MLEHLITAHGARPYRIIFDETSPGVLSFSQKCDARCCQNSINCPIFPGHGECSGDGAKRSEGEGHAKGEDYCRFPVPCFQIKLTERGQMNRL